MNVDFQDVRTVMENRKNALIGIGVASGPNRFNEALHAAISSPLLEDATLGRHRCAVSYSLWVRVAHDDREPSGQRLAHGRDR